MGIENRDYNINPSTEQNRPASFVSSHGVFPSMDVKPVVILEKSNHVRRASPQVQEARNLVLRASQEGYLDSLTETQRPIVEERYLSEKGMVVSFKLVQERLGVNVTRSALHFAHRSGIERLRRMNRGESINRSGRPRKSEQPQTSKELSGVQRRRIAKQAIVIKAEQENGLSNLNPREYQILKTMYLTEDRTIVSPKQVAEELGMKPKLVLAHEGSGINKLKNSDTLTSTRGEKVQMRLSIRARYRAHQITVREAFSKGLSKILTKQERRVLETLYINLESDTLPVLKAGSILQKPAFLIRSQERSGRKKLEAELQKL